MIINSCKIHAPLRKILCKKRLEGKIHSVFKHVINIIIPDDELMIVSILANTNEVFPMSVILSADTFDFSTFTIGENVFLSESQIIIGHKTIKLSIANSYDINLPNYIENPNLSQNIAFAHSIIVKYKNVENSVDVFAYKSQEFLQSSLAQAKAAFHQGNIDIFLSSLIDIIGLGLGLTPSGDDYLTALIALIKLPNSPLGKLENICPAIVYEAKTKTNLLSCSYLNRSAKGCIRGKLINFIEAVMTSINIEAAVVELLNIGASSGKDFALGVLFGFELIEMTKQSRCL